jgi:ubiquinone/menaquinone biosynthesis C-methylase UbiE
VHGKEEVSKMQNLSFKRMIFKFKKDLFNYKPTTLMRYLSLQKRNALLGSGEFYVPRKGKEDWRLYGDLQNVSHLIRYEWAHHVLRDKGTSKVLDIACGCGYGSHLLSQSVTQVYGVDLSTKAIEYAKSNYQKDNIEFVQGDIVDLLTTFDKQSFDAIVSFDTVEHIRTEKWLEIFRDLLKRSGSTLLLSTPVRAETTRNPANKWHFIEYSAEDLLGKLSIFDRVLYGDAMPHYAIFEEANLKFKRSLFAKDPNPCVCESL